ncbi:hypothetical protein [Novosphingobium lindaniclasticum]
MPAFYLTFVAVLLAGFGARDQMTISGLAARQGQRPGVLLAALLSAGLTAAGAAWAAAFMLAQLPPPARMIFAAFAVGLAGLESLILVPRRRPKEPTNSLGALLLVLLASQIADAARFIVFAMGVGMAAPVASGVAGALGGGVLAGMAWAFPQFSSAPAAGWIRRGVGLLLVCAALMLFLRESSIL